MSKTNEELIEEVLDEAFMYKEDEEVNEALIKLAEKKDEEFLKIIDEFEDKYNIKDKNNYYKMRMILRGKDKGGK